MESVSSEGLAHPSNPTLQSEHSAAMDLADPAEATHVAVASGDWLSPDTWSGGVIPGSGSRVLIPENFSVEVSAELDSPLEWVRVNGVLRFADSQNTSLKLGTLVTAPGSLLQIGDSLNPINADVTARIVFADLGPLDVSKDPLLLGRGAILHGTTSFHGARKTTKLAVERDPRQGDRELLLQEVPEGWQPGDRLVVAGTRPDAQGDEVVIVEAIEGNRVVIATPLSDDHITPRDHLKVHVANLSRNVILSSESKELDRRGHVMFMHSRDVEVAYAAFNDLGRTDKLRPLDNPYFDDEGFYVEGTGGNAGGRYSLHFHRNGVKRNAPPAVVRGSVVSGNPGWGFVNHSSYVDFIDNVAYDVVGAAFSTEAGNEIGSFQNNIAIRMHGTGEEPISRQEEGDFGHAGDGYWLQGPGVSVENNIAVGATGSGLILYAEPLFEDGLGVTAFSSGNLPDPALAEGAESVPVSLAPLTLFRGNESYGSRLGAQIYYHRTLITIEEEQQGQASLVFPLSVVEDMDLWSNANGMMLNYTVDTQFSDISIIGPADGSGDIGLDAGSNFYNRGTHLYDNLVIADYEIGFALPRSGSIEVVGGYFDNLTDFYINEPRQLGRRLRFSGDLRFGDRRDGVVDGERVPRSYFELDPEFAPAADSANEHFLLDDQVILDFGPYRNQQLYFYEQSADYILFPEAPDQLTPDDPGPTIGDEFIGLSNGGIQSLVDNSFGGAIAPENAVEIDRIQGLVGSPAAEMPVLDPNPLPEEERELEIVLEPKVRRSRFSIKNTSLVQRSEGDLIRFPIDSIDLLTFLGSDDNDRLDLKVRSMFDAELDAISIFAGGGRDRINLRSSGGLNVESVVLQGEEGDDRLNAMRYSGSVELDGGSGRDILTGGSSGSDLWGGTGGDTFKLRESAGLQRLMDFDPDVDRLRLMFEPVGLSSRVVDDDLLLMLHSQELALFVGLADQRETIHSLLV